MYTIGHTALYAQPLNLVTVYTIGHTGQFTQPLNLVNVYTIGHTAQYTQPLNLVNVYTLGHNGLNLLFRRLLFPYCSYNFLIAMIINIPYI